jgi:hypothetical protein
VRQRPLMAARYCSTNAGSDQVLLHGQERSLLAIVPTAIMLRDLRLGRSDERSVLPLWELGRYPPRCHNRSVPGTAARSRSASNANAREAVGKITAPRGIRVLRIL